MKDIEFYLGQETNWSNSEEETIKECYKRSKTPLGIQNSISFALEFNPLVDYTIF